MKEITAKYESALEQEREKVKRLEVEIKVIRQEIDFVSKGQFVNTLNNESSF